jgi:hypothetical protein
MEHPPTGSTRGAAALDQDRGCIRCSYNLRGLPASGRCPECGTPVADPLRGFLLQYAGEPYLRSLRSVLSLVLNGILLAIVMIMVSVPAGDAGQDAARLASIVAVVPTGMIFWGSWKDTEPDPGYVGREPPRSARQVARGAVAAQAALQALAVVDDFGGLPGSVPGSTAYRLLKGLAALTEIVALAVQFFAIMAYTRWLAERVPDRYVVRRSRTFRWLPPLLTIVGAVAMMLGPLIALILDWNLLDRMRKHLKAILAGGAPANRRHRLG